MSVQQFVAVVGTAIFLNLAGSTFGTTGQIAIICLLGVVGLIVMIRAERRRARLLDSPGVPAPDALDDSIARLEHALLHAQALHQTGVTPPRVPLRRPVETFAYRPSHVRTVRWALYLWLYVGGVLVVGALSDVALGREQFLGLYPSALESAALALLWTVGTALAGWLLRESRCQLRVSEEGLELQRPGGRSRRIAWGEIERARFGTLSHRLRVASRTEQIVIGDTMQDYGRLLTLVLSRLPAPTGTART